MSGHIAALANSGTLATLNYNCNYPTLILLNDTRAPLHEYYFIVKINIKIRDGTDFGSNSKYQAQSWVGPSSGKSLLTFIQGFKIVII